MIKNGIIEVEHVQQPTAHTCVHACLAMVTGLPVEHYIERFGDDGTGLGYTETTLGLIESKVLQTPIPLGAPHPFPLYGAYVISAPSLNLPGRMHSLVVTSDRETGYKIYDPNRGRKGKKHYKVDDELGSVVPYTDVMYMDAETLKDLRMARVDANRS